MRKLTGAVFQSLDGVMQAPGGPEEDPTSHFRFGGWAQLFWDEMSPFEELIMGEYDLLLGRRTYDIFAAYWPNNQENPIGEKFSLVTCAAAPSLFYADWIEPIPSDCPRLAALRAELLALPEVARCVEDARPYRAYFPYGAPDRD